VRFDGKVVLVTGASRGIGAATAKLFGAEGATVIVNYSQSEDRARDVVNAIIAGGGAAEAICADVRDGDAVTAMVKDVAKRHGTIDVLVNNAGVTRDTLTAVMEDAEWDDVMAINAGGMFKCARAVCRPMMRARTGVIINVSSVAGSKGGRGQTNYAASKGAIEAFTRSLAVELAPRGIRVNAVAPGVIVTDMSAFVREQAEDEVLSKILLGRYGEVDEVAQVIAFLASDAAAYVTGAIVPVDGGFKMR
jgi:3-oxoacyl-[acyl-carrier protein] reductase